MGRLIGSQGFGALDPDKSTSKGVGKSAVLDR